MSATTSPANETFTNTNDGKQVNVGHLPVVAVCPETTTDFTFNFPVGSANYGELARWGYAASVDVDAAVLVNVSDYDVTFDQVALTGVQTIDKGITLGCQIVKANPALPASVTLQIIHSPFADSMDVPDYTYLQWVLASEVLENDQFLEATKHSLITENSSVGYTRLARSTQQVQGIFTVEIDSSQIGSFWGLSTQVGISQNVDYGWNFAALGQFILFEGGSPVEFPATANDNTANVGIQIRDTGSAIEYWMREPGSSYMLVYTSGAAYTPNTPFWVDIIAQYDSQPISPIKLYES